jgi:hypothetical protein
MASPILIAVKLVAAIAAAISLNWLVSNVDTHSLHIQLGLQSQLESAHRPRPPLPRSETPGIDVGGLDIIECMCSGPVGTDIRGWLGLWFVTVLIGGLPAAVLARSCDLRED